MKKPLNLENDSQRALLSINDRNEGINIRKSKRTRVVRQQFNKVTKFQAINMPRIKLSQILQDLYYHLIRMGWVMFFVTTTVFYILVSTIFFLIYIPFKDGLDPRPESNAALFFFSFGRLVGLDGRFEPQDIIPEGVAILESFCCVVIASMLTGILYARFSRPNTRVMFSKYVLHTTFNGQPAIIFRVANSRSTHIMEAQARLFCLKREILPEGIPFSRLYSLELQRDITPTFATYPWTVIHVIDESSPLYGMSVNQFVENDCSITALISGVDVMFNNTVHAHQQWQVESLIFGGVFKDMVSVKNGTRYFNYEFFDELQEQEEEVFKC